jgi:hypothetical protein
MDLLNKIGDAFSYVFVDYPLSFIPTREKVAEEFVNWQRDRLNSCISQVLIFILIIPFSMFLNWGFIYEYSGGGMIGMIYSIISHTFVIIPAIRGYAKLKARVQEKIQTRDPVKMIEHFITWWRQPSDPILRNIILFSIPLLYVIFFNYQEWIGYQIGGFIVYRTLRIVMQIMLLSYSNMIFELVSSIWSTREINKIVDQFDSQIPPGSQNDNIDFSPDKMDQSFVMIDPVRQPIPDPILEPVLEPVREPVLEPVNVPVIVPVHEPVRVSVREPVRVSVREPVLNPVIEAVHEPVREPVLNPVIEAVHEPVRESVLNPVHEAVLDPVIEPVSEPVLEPVLDPVHEAVKESNVNVVDSHNNQMIDSVGIDNLEVHMVQPFLDENGDRIKEVVKPKNDLMGNSLLFQSAVIVDASSYKPIQEVRSGGSIKDRLKIFEKFQSGGN